MIKSSTIAKTKSAKELLLANKKLETKLQVALGLIKEANNMIEGLKGQALEVDVVKKYNVELEKEIKGLRSHWMYKFSNWLKSFVNGND